MELTTIKPAEETSEQDALQAVLAGLEKGLTLLPAGSSWRLTLTRFRGGLCRYLGACPLAPVQLPRDPAPEDQPRLRRVAG